MYKKKLDKYKSAMFYSFIYISFNKCINNANLKIFFITERNITDFLSQSHIKNFLFFWNFTLTYGPLVKDYG